MREGGRARGRGGKEGKRVRGRKGRGKRRNIKIV